MKIILVCLSLIMIIIASMMLQPAKPQTIVTKAQSTDPNFCQNSCAAFNRCDLNNPNDPAPGIDPNYNDPCCQELAKTGDPMACAWPQRGYCTIDQCNAISSGTPRQRCGGPRNSWCNLCRQNNCPGYGPSPVPFSTPTSAPTAVPTFAPTVVPTVTPIIPTETPFPTSTAVVPTNAGTETTPTPTSPPNGILLFPTTAPFPTIEPTTVPFTLPSFSLPAFNLPSVHTNIADLNQATKKPLGFLEYLFETVRSYDQKLEETINNRIGIILQR